jgi:hypothetical protein
MHSIFAKSNIYEALYHSYEELCTFGTSAMFLTEDYNDVIRARSFTERLDACLRSGEVLARYITAVALSSFAARDGGGARRLLRAKRNRGRGHYVYANSKGERQSIFAAAKVEWLQPLLLVLAINQI